MKSETATEFCKCCYPEPEEADEAMTQEQVMSYYIKGKKLPPKRNKYQSLADYNRPRQHSESNEEQIIQISQHDNSNDGQEDK